MLLQKDCPLNRIISLALLVCALPGFRLAMAQSFYLSSTPQAGYDSMTVAAADFNGDGKIDLAGSDNNSVLTILTNNGNGGFSVCSNNRYFFSILSITAADVNHDGNVDIITANRYNHTITTLTNNGSGFFRPSQTNAAGNEPYWVAVADIAGDTNLDLAAANFGDATVTIFTNNGSGIFQSNAAYAAGSAGAFQLAAADLNSDG